MEDISFTLAERTKVEEYFGRKPEELELKEFEAKHRELRAKYHPDKFEKYSDEIIKELTAEKFKEIEQLAGKIRKFILAGNIPRLSDPEYFGHNAAFAWENLKIEIRTSEKDLKYYLFGAHFRWLERGDKFVIPGTKASIVIDGDHSGRSIGFNEGVKMYLTFSKEDSLEEIITWLYLRIAAYASLLIIEGKVVKVDFFEMLQAVGGKTLLRLN